MSSSQIVSLPRSLFMSDTLQASVYENVISATVTASTEDFIDSGLSLDILDSLKEVSPQTPHPSPNFALTVLELAEKASSFGSCYIQLATRPRIHTARLGTFPNGVGAETSR